MSEIFFHRNDSENRKNISWSSGLYGTDKKKNLTNEGSGNDQDM